MRLSGFAKKYNEMHSIHRSSCLRRVKNPCIGENELFPTIVLSYSHFCKRCAVNNKTSLELTWCCHLDFRHSNRNIYNIFVQITYIIKIGIKEISPQTVIFHGISLFLNGITFPGSAYRVSASSPRRLGHYKLFISWKLFLSAHTCPSSWKVEEKRHKVRNVIILPPHLICNQRDVISHGFRATESDCLMSWLCLQSKQCDTMWYNVAPRLCFYTNSDVELQYFMFPS